MGSAPSTASVLHGSTSVKDGQGWTTGRFSLVIAPESILVLISLFLTEHGDRHSSIRQLDRLTEAESCRLVDR